MRIKNRVERPTDAQNPNLQLLHPPGRHRAGGVGDFRGEVGDDSDPISQAGKLRRVRAGRLPLGAC